MERMTKAETAIREVLELAKDFNRGKQSDKQLFNIREEIADVEIMLYQMRLIFDDVNSINSIDELKSRKIELLKMNSCVSFTLQEQMLMEMKK